MTKASVRSYSDSTIRTRDAARGLREGDEEHDQHDAVFGSNNRE